MFKITPQIIQQTADYLKIQLAIKNPYHTISYKDVVNYLQLPELDGNWNSHPLCKIFDQLDKEDTQLNRPFRTSIVIKKSINMPGPGFFDALRNYKGQPIPQNNEKRQLLWYGELNLAKQYNY